MADKVLAKAGPFELMVPCMYSHLEGRDFCTGLADDESGPAPRCAPCAASVRIASLMSDYHYAKACKTPGDGTIYRYEGYIRDLLERLGPEMVALVGRQELWTEYMES